MTTRDLTIAIARRILANIEAGRIYDGKTIEWARRMVQAKGTVTP